jgi:hypothetical protein
VLLPTSTPREALAFTAALRLPGHSAAARHARAAAVQGMLAGMALTHCADTLVRVDHSIPVYFKNCVLESQGSCQHGG